MLTTLLLCLSAHAIPTQLNHQGRLMDSDGVGLSGEHELTFTLMADAEYDVPVWTETLSVEFTNGYYSVILGANLVNNPLDEETFSQHPLWLELIVDESDPLSPRHRLTSVPYAQIAGVAELADSATVADTALSVEGGSVDASELSVNGSPIVDSGGNWVGPTPAIDFTELSGVPAGLDDGDDDTQLDQAGVLAHVSGQLVNLGAGSTLDGLDLITIDTDMDSLADISCVDGEVLMWNGLMNQWDCGFGSDTLLTLSCVDGEVPKWDAANSVWGCAQDLDTDSTLSQSDVLGYVDGQSLNLAAGSTVGGAAVVTDSNFSSHLPADLADGDADTQLDQAGVLAHVSGQVVNLGAGSSVNGAAVLTQPGACGDAEVLVYSLQTASWACGTDTDSTLTAAEVQAMVESVSGLALQAGATVGGSPILSDASTLNPANLDSSGASADQVLTYDGASIGWADAAGGAESPMRLGESDGGEFYSSLDTPLSIPDDVVTGITSARYIATATTITTMSLELDVTHPDMAEVTVVLTSPSGTALTIYDGNDPGVANFSRNIGWDAAFNSGNLYSFFGESTDGTWTMNVYDTGAGNSGSLDGWTLRFNEGHDGELFVGNELTVQGTARVRDQLRVEYGGSMVFTDEDGNETLSIDGSTGTINAASSINLYLEPMACGGGLGSSGTCKSMVCGSDRYHGQTVYFTCNNTCYNYNSSYTSPQNCSTTLLGSIPLF